MFLIYLIDMPSSLKDIFFLFVKLKKKKLDTATTMDKFL